MASSKLLRMDNVGIVVESLDKSISFFEEIGLRSIRWAICGRCLPLRMLMSWWQDLRNGMGPGWLGKWFSMKILTGYAMFGQPTGCLWDWRSSSSREWSGVVGVDIEARLLPPDLRNYTEDYWKRRVFAPSCLIFYLGLNKRLEGLRHHTLFFDEDIDGHALEIYKNPSWPTKPLFYVCRTTASDRSVAPEGKDNLFLLMPIAPGLEDSPLIREAYFDVMAGRIMRCIGEDIRPFIEYKRSYSIDDFTADYGAYEGNAYGLANTILQTAVFKPKIINKKVRNIVYAGQLTVPGPGVPPALISGKIAAGVLAGRL